MQTNYNFFQNTYKTYNFLYKETNPKAFTGQHGEKLTNPEAKEPILDKTKVHIRDTQKMAIDFLKQKQTDLERQSEKVKAKLAGLKTTIQQDEGREVLTPIQQKELDYFLSEKSNPKERYVLYNILKYGLGKSNMQVNQNWSLAKLRSQFTEELSSETGFYYKGNTLVVVRSFFDLIKRGGLGGNIKIDNCSFLVFHSNPEKYFMHDTNADSNYHSGRNSQGFFKGVADKYLIRFKEHQNGIADTNETRRKISEKGLERYVIYRFLENYNFEVDYNWTDRELLDYLAVSGSFSRFYIAQHVKNLTYQNDRKIIIKNILKEYAEYTGGGMQISNEYIRAVTDRILELMRSNHK